MSINRKTEIKRESLTAPYIKKDKEFYLDYMDIEEKFLKKAIEISERMMVAFMRENKVEVKVDVDDISNKIIEKIIDKLPKAQYIQVSASDIIQEKPKDGFSLDDGPVVVKTEKMEIKGKLGNSSISKDSIDKNLDVLDNFSL